MGKLGENDGKWWEHDGTCGNMIGITGGLIYLTNQRDLNEKHHDATHGAPR